MLWLKNETIIRQSLCALLCLIAQSCPTLFESVLTVACQVSRPWGFFKQEYWSGLPCPPPGDLPNPGIKPRSPALQADSLPSEPPGKPKNTGVVSLSLLQIFPIREWNLGLLHGRRILLQAELLGKSRQSLTVVNYVFIKPQ